MDRVKKYYTLSDCGERLCVYLARGSTTEFKYIINTLIEIFGGELTRDKKHIRYDSKEKAEAAAEWIKSYKMIHQLTK